MTERRGAVDIYMFCSGHRRNSRKLVIVRHGRTVFAIGCRSAWVRSVVVAAVIVHVTVMF
jgi:hypothetical protein